VLLGEDGCIVYNNIKSELEKVCYISPQANLPPSCKPIFAAIKAPPISAPGLMRHFRNYHFGTSQVGVKISKISRK
jgi:hypothetical protein